MRFLPILLLLASACQKNVEKPVDPLQKPAELPVAQTTTTAPAVFDPELEFRTVRERTLPAVNDRLPRSLMDRLQFGPQIDDKHRVVAVVPVNWTVDPQTGAYRPPLSANLGAATSMTFGSGCDGRCTVKDWPAAFDKVEIRRQELQKIESDEPIGPNGRLVVAQSGSLKLVMAGLWKPEANRYFFCRASLEGAAMEALPAFLTACRSLDVRHWE